MLRTGRSISRLFCFAFFCAALIALVSSFDLLPQQAGARPLAVLPAALAPFAAPGPGLAFWTDLTPGPRARIVTTVRGPPVIEVTHIEPTAAGFWAPVGRHRSIVVNGRAPA